MVAVFKSSHGNIKAGETEEARKWKGPWGKGILEKSLVRSKRYEWGNIAWGLFGDQKGSQY